MSARDTSFTTTRTRLVVVTGKGGVGKSIISAALALALPQDARHVIVAEVAGRDDAARLLGGAGVGRLWRTRRGRSGPARLDRFRPCTARIPEGASSVAWHCRVAATDAPVLRVDRGHAGPRRAAHDRQGVGARQGGRSRHRRARRSGHRTRTRVARGAATIQSRHPRGPDRRTVGLDRRLSARPAADQHRRGDDGGGAPRQRDAGPARSADLRARALDRRRARQRGLPPPLQCSGGGCARGRTGFAGQACRAVVASRARGHRSQIRRLRAALGAEVPVPVHALPFAFDSTDLAAGLAARLHP